MGLFDRFKKPEPVKAETKPKEKKKSKKELATEKGEPYVEIISVYRKKT
jgi:hypothetical protein